MTPRSDPNPAARPRRSLAWLAAKIAALAVILALAIAFDLVDVEMLRSAAGQPGMMVLAVLLVFVALVLAGLRWAILLSLVGTPIGPIVSFNIVAASTFVSMAMLGVVGGEALRAVYLARALDANRARAVSTIMVDRMLGALALLILALWATLAVGQYDELRRPLLFFTIFAGVVLAGLVLVLILVRRLSDSFARLLRADERRGWLGIPARILQALLDIAVMNRRNALGLGAGLLLSLLSHVCSLGAIVVVAQTLVPGFTVAQHAFAGAMALWANMIPITPGGIGFGEGVFELVCRMVGGAAAQGAGTAFLVFRGLALIAVLYGAVALVFGIPSGRSPRTAEVGTETAAASKL